MSNVTPFRRRSHIRHSNQRVFAPFNLLLFGALPLGVFSAVFLWGTGPESKAAAIEGFGGVVVDVKFGKCAFGLRNNCIVDGDTIWYQGEKIRIADIDTPEVGKPGCDREKSLGDQATDRMQALLNEGSFTLTRPPGTPNRDRYDRLLRTAERGGSSVGDTLVAEGLAEEWGGRRIAWCG